MKIGPLFFGSMADVVQKDRIQCHIEVRKAKLQLSTGGSCSALGNPLRHGKSVAGSPILT